MKGAPGCLREVPLEKGEDQYKGHGGWDHQKQPSQFGCDPTLCYFILIEAEPSAGRQAGTWSIQCILSSQGRFVTLNYNCGIIV